ncbi:MAG: tyrosine-type recombinase/integrase [Desulfuromonadales bacterium]|nr:tyrosine-type recombinase/integrase [Gammaproteobacteria bacterium]NIR34233.1 tyrosine-type recombinase/integrase [Desulfuromonadales bacterium]NIR82349.1 tyrosine-type recombinase/integrase [Gammaproteobacteria bacterium]NIU03502.1 tyrosine-type recombinase/integrase [Gammaproteobacteria bacterium]NIV50906.1 tyrosine-type recombinase/integrase [Gammaproteobacteria bacterium]
MLHTLFPRTHRRYEGSCCARELEAFGAWLLASGYSRENTCDHLYRLRCVLERVSETRANATLSTSQLADFFRLPGAPAWRVLLSRATQRAYERFLASRGRLHDDTTVRPPFALCLDKYGQFLQEVRGFAAVTRAQHLSTLSDFLAGTLGPSCSLATLTSAHVERYVTRKGGQVSRQTLQHTVAHLRAFLRYAFERRLIAERLDRIDTPRTYRSEQPPRALPWPLVVGLLRSIDRSSKAGWRDYAILHLMAHYALRPSEIVALELGSVSFEAKRLCVEQRKTHSQLLLPLAAPTVRILRSYLRHGRPASVHRELFLRVRRPAGALKHTAICNIFKKRAQECGLPPGRYSAYSLRHSFAMRLLERGVGLKAIGDLLGHRSLESTCVYLRLDIQALRAVALPVPRLARA